LIKIDFQPQDACFNFERIKEIDKEFMKKISLKKFPLFFFHFFHFFFWWKKDLFEILSKNFKSFSSKFQ